MPSRVYAIAQQKGGVGKTTTAINLGAALAERGRRVLLIDMDPQGALTAGLGFNPLSLAATIHNVLREPNRPLADTILQSESGCDLVPANIDLAASEMQLVSEPGRERILRERIEPVLDRYDYVLLDCPPSLNTLTLNALSAAAGTVIPVQTQYFALRGMDLLLETVEKVKARLNPSLEIVGILPTIYDGRTNHGREVLEEIRSAYGDLVFNTVIPATVKAADSVMAGQSLLKYQPASPIAKAYRELAQEVDSNVDQARAAQ